MGLKSTPGKQIHGCILADDMGLGKTIQAISILWTLLKQGPEGVPAVRKAAIICPSSLVGNWGQELEKWLGDRVKYIQIGESNKKNGAKIGKLQYGEFDVLIISYDQLKIAIKDMKTIWNLDLIICDEGHRLKNSKTKQTQAVDALPTKNRILLSGTPLQNDLEEFYCMVNLVNPGCIGDYATFRSVYEEPIMASRDELADDETRAHGAERWKALLRITAPFILRRTSAINSQYLPPKVDYIVCCELTELQKSLYLKLSDTFINRTKQDKIEALPLINSMKKLCNTPQLLYKHSQEPEHFLSVIGGDFPPEFIANPASTQFSGKLAFLEKLLVQVRARKEKIVIVSNYTQTLEIIAALCKTNKWPFYTLDGSTPVKKRQLLVDVFNKPETPEFIFLLSSKAGGCGLNLIGANHLVLYDPDWNPANDEQAMARVWRPGQQKRVFLYRLLSTGTLEEKVYQRQLTKLALAKNVVDQDVNAKPSFSASELRDLFKYRGKTPSDTHDLLNCPCARGEKIDL